MSIKAMIAKAYVTAIDSGVTFHYPDTSLIFNVGLNNMRIQDRDALGSTVVTKDCNLAGLLIEHGIDPAEFREDFIGKGLTYSTYGGRNEAHYNPLTEEQWDLWMDELREEGAE